jgi:hypothetical protein
MTACEAFAALLDGRFDLFMQDLLGSASPAGRQATAAMRLDVYLLGPPFSLSAWQQDLLLRHRRITVTRKLADGRLTTFRESLDLSFMLNTPSGVTDWVDIDFRDAAYQQELDALAAGAKDYAFVAPHDLDDMLLVTEEAIQQSKGVVVFGQSSLVETATTTLEQFIEKLRTSERVAGPARHLVVISHAHWIGELDFAANVVSRTESMSYENVVRNERLPSQPLHVPDGSLDPRTSASPTPCIVFTGCEIGHARKYLERLRKVLNPSLRLYGPKYWFAAGRTDEGEGFEFMGQPLIVSSKNPLDRAGLIEALKNLHASYVGGDAIRDDEWESLVPPEPWDTDDEWFITRRIDVRMPAIDTSAGRIDARALSLDCAALWKTYISPTAIRCRFVLDTRLTEQQVLQDPVLAWRNAVKAVPDNPANPLSIAHEFPAWERFRFPAADGTRQAANAAIDRWIDSLNWDVTYTTDDLDKHRLRAEGEGYKYVFTIPIARPGSGALAHRDLVVNYYVGSQSGPVREDLKITNTDFWVALP